jgi:hypothetical protein
VRIRARDRFAQEQQKLGVRTSLLDSLEADVVVNVVGRLLADQRLVRLVLLFQPDSKDTRLCVRPNQFVSISVSSRHHQSMEEKMQLDLLRRIPVQTALPEHVKEVDLVADKNVWVAREVALARSGSRLRCPNDQEIDPEICIKTIGNMKFRNVNQNICSNDQERAVMQEITRGGIRWSCNQRIAISGCNPFPAAIAAPVAVSVPIPIS